MKIVLYTLEGCPGCDVVKDYFATHNIDYDTVHVPNDMNPHAFTLTFPDSEGFPHCMIDGEFIPDPILYLQSGF